MNVRSMTGFARLRGSSTEGEIVLSVKTLNHRGLDVHFYMPGDLDPFETALRVAIKRHIARGHVDVRISFLRNASATGEVALNVPMLDAYVSSFRKAAARHNLTGDPDLNNAFRLPGLLSFAQEAEPSSSMEAFLVQLLEDAIVELNRFREREGAGIAAVMRERSAAIRSAAEEIARIRTQALPVFQSRLQQRLLELLNGAQIEPQRLIQEAAILADRSDIGEELDRLRIHSSELEEIIDAGGEMGKKLDFLLQEMNRETNTILSKTGGTGEIGMTITARALAVKADIEKIREQSLNLE